MIDVCEGLECLQKCAVKRVYHFIIFQHQGGVGDIAFMNKLFLYIRVIVNGGFLQEFR